MDKNGKVLDQPFFQAEATTRKLPASEPIRLHGQLNAEPASLRFGNKRPSQLETSILESNRPRVIEYVIAGLVGLCIIIALIVWWRLLI